MVGFTELTLAFLVSVSPCDINGAPRKHDARIERHVRRYWPLGHEAFWCFMKSQIMAESAFKPKAVSPAGAVGLSQAMKPTWDEWTVRLKTVGDRRNERASIRFMAAYMGWQITGWPSKRSAPCRVRLGAAGYNPGRRWVYRAQALSGMKSCWVGIAPHLHKVTGRHSKETIAYIRRIDRIFKRAIGRKAAGLWDTLKDSS